MARKEVYATTGPRMMVRFFGGWDYTADDLNSRQPAFRGYEKGVPMGGDLRPERVTAAPTFMVYALRDPIGANLDRIQIVKGWLDKMARRTRRSTTSPGRRAVSPMPTATAAGGQHGGREERQLDQHHRRLGTRTVWTDPGLRPGQSAFYYARVLEIPTPRWVVYDAFRFGVEIPEGPRPSRSAPTPRRSGTRREDN
jgi:hypothetical protein